MACVMRAYIIGDIAVNDEAVIDEFCGRPQIHLAWLSDFRGFRSEEFLTTSNAP